MNVRNALFFLASVYLAVLAVLTQNQIGYWKDAVTLWNHQLDYTPRLILAWANLGTYYQREERYTEAMGHNLMALYYAHRPGRLAPYEYTTACGVWWNLVGALWTMDRRGEATHAWSEAVRTGCLRILPPGPHDLG